MKNTLSAIRLLLLPGAFFCALSCRHGEGSQLPEEFHLLRQYAKHTTISSKNSSDKQVEKVYAQALHLLEQRRNAVEKNTAEELDSQLRALAIMLTDMIADAPDAVNTFVLAELLSNPAFPDGARQLAIILYQYGHQRSLILSTLRSGSMYAENTNSTPHIASAEKLLLQAAAAEIPEAYWQLYRLYTATGNTASADNALQAAVRRGHRDALAAAECKNFTADELDYKSKEQFLFRALEHNFYDAAEKLSDFYISKPNQELPMAFNAALLAYRMNGQTSALERLQQSGKEFPPAVIQHILWQNRLRTVCDLERIDLNTDRLLNSLRYPETAGETRQEIAGLLHNSPDKFFLSGLPWLLLDSGCYQPEELKALFRQTPEKTLPLLLTSAAIAGKYSDGAWQLESTTGLLVQIAAMELPQPAVNCRKRLMSVLPNAALLNLTERTLYDPQENFMLLWNVTVDMHINALLLTGNRAGAEAFLKKYPRWQLTLPSSNMEKNLVKNTCHALLSSHTEMQ